MIQTKLEDCIALMEEVSQNEQIDSENQELFKKNGTFFNVYDKYFIKILNSYKLSKNIDEIVFSDDIKENLRECIKYAKDTFERKIVINPKKFEKRVESLNDKFLKEWNNQISSKLINIKEDLGTAKLISDNPLEIQKMLIDLNNFSKWPIDQNMYDNFISSYNKANDLLSKVQFDNDNIRIFLEKIKNKEATLNDISADIFDWIKKENLLDNIILSIKK